MQISRRPNLAVRPTVAVRPAAPAATAAPAPKAAPRPVAKPAAKPEAISNGQIAGAVSGGAAGAAVGYIFGSVLSAGGLSGLLPVGLALGGAALLARGGMVIADAIAGKAGKPTLLQGIAGGVAGTVAGAAVWGLTAFAGGMAMVPWIAMAAIPMGLATAVLGGVAVGSFLPGRK